MPKQSQLLPNQETASSRRTLPAATSIFLVKVLHQIIRTIVLKVLTCYTEFSPHIPVGRGNAIRSPQNIRPYSFFRGTNVTFP